MDDLFGKALLNYQQQAGNQELITWTSLTEEDPVPLSYFFRGFEKMPTIEKKALQLASGKVLDIGCGSGSHSLYLQNEKGLDVTGIDRSQGAIDVAKMRGLKKIRCQSIMDLSGEKFDTILLLMNGIGIAQNFKGVVPLLSHLKTLLHPEGQILVDSSDLIYLFPEEEQLDWQMADSYYGELDYGIRFAGEEQEFPWLYLDYNHLETAANLAQLHCEKVLEGPNYDFLACLTAMEY